MTDDLTIVRLRGSLVLGLESATAINDGFDVVSAGICNVTENAFGAGVTAIPDPIADIAWDGWLWHWDGSLMALKVAALGDAGLSNIGAYVVPIDNKAVRNLNGLPRAI